MLSRHWCKGFFFLRWIILLLFNVSILAKNLSYHWLRFCTVVLIILIILLTELVWHQYAFVRLYDHIFWLPVAIRPLRHSLIIHRNLLPRVLACNMLHQLVLSVVFNRAETARIGLVISMTSFVVAAVPNRCEALWAKAAMVGFFTGVCTGVYKQITLFCKDFTTARYHTFKEIVARVDGLNVKVKPWCTWESFLAADDYAYVSIDIEVASFVVLQVLFQLKSLRAPGVGAFEYPIRELNRYNILLEIHVCECVSWGCLPLWTSGYTRWMGNGVNLCDLSNSKITLE